MEVHHHPQVEKKTFKEYLLEFIMIFLAVSLGFIAENLREWISDRRYLHQYMQSMVNDLQSDLQMYDSGRKFNLAYAAMIDTIILSVKEKRDNAGEVYLMARNLTRGSSVITPNSKTFEQMKSANGLRLIDRRKIGDDIASYYQWIKRFEYWSDLQRQRINDIINNNDKMFSAVDFYSIVHLNDSTRKDSLRAVLSRAKYLSTDIAAVNPVLMRMQYYYGLLQLMNQRMQLASQSAKQLIGELNDEYDLREK